MGVLVNLVMVGGGVIFLVEAAKRGILLWALAALLAVVVVSAILWHRRDQTWRKALARRRQQELGIDAEQAFALFAGHPDFADCDPKVVRAVHDELQALASAPDHPIPLRATDNLERDLRIDVDLDDTVEPLEAATGRKLRWRPGQPSYVINTVADLIRCWSDAQKS